MGEQGFVLLQKRQDLAEIEGRRGLGAFESGGNLARVLDEGAGAVARGVGVAGAFQEEIHDVGVHRIEHGVEHQVEHLLDRERGRDGLADFVDGERVLEAQVLVLQALPVEPALDDVDDLLDLEGF